MKKIPLIFLLLGISIILISQTDSSNIIDEETIINADNYKIYEIGYFPYSTVKIEASMVGDYEETTQLVEIRIYYDSNIDYFIQGDYEKSALSPHKRMFINSNETASMTETLETLEKSYILINNIIKVSNKNVDKEIYIKVDVLKPYFYLLPVGIILSLVSIIILLKQYIRH